MSGHLPGVLKPITVPASWIYRFAIARRNARYDRPEHVTQLPVPVISIGNLTTGGTGKSPMVSWVVELLRDAGHRPTIAMRGYGARAGEESDEALEYRDRLPGVPVLVNPDRVAAITRALANQPEIDCVVLDDGFQHRRVARSLDLVLIDASRSTHRDALLPVGTLREPPESLGRADAVILTHASRIEPALEQWVERYHGAPALARTRHTWRGLHVHNATGSTAQSVAWLEGRRVVTLLGIGNPQAILGQVRAAGADVLINATARDHERYDRTRILSLIPLCDRADALFTTRKDWVKLRSLIDFSSFPVPVVTPDLGLTITDGEQQLRTRILEAMREGQRERQP